MRTIYKQLVLQYRKQGYHNQTKAYRMVYQNLTDEEYKEKKAANEFKDSDRKTASDIFNRDDVKEYLQEQKEESRALELETIESIESRRADIGDYVIKRNQQLSMSSPMVFFKSDGTIDMEKLTRDEGKIVKSVSFHDKPFVDKDGKPHPILKKIEVVPQDFAINRLQNYVRFDTLEERKNKVEKPSKENILKDILQKIKDHRAARDKNKKLEDTN